MSKEFKNENFKSNELSKCPFTGAGTSAKFSAGRGQTNIAHQIPSQGTFVTKYSLINGEYQMDDS